jgi:hypothetical protein
MNRTNPMGVVWLAVMVCLVGCGGCGDSGFVKDSSRVEPTLAPISTQEDSGQTGSDNDRGGESSSSFSESVEYSSAPISSGLAYMPGSNGTSGS